MLGKRPRPLQRTTSRSQFSDPFDSGDKPMPPSPALGTPRQVIGFNPVNKNNPDSGESPRSVLDPRALSGIIKVGSQEKQARSPRSPRSGLESLLSSPRCPWDRKGSEGVGLGIVAAIHAEEEDAAKARVVEVGKGTTGPVTPVKCYSIRSPTQSQPIPIVQIQLQSNCRGGKELQQSKAKHSRRAQTRKLSLGVEDEEMETRESIFSTASPASNCSENWGDWASVDFLNSCFFCKRGLGPGKDIYMYRGDRAFCSIECRYQQIVMDERKERCSAAAFKSGATVASGASNHRNNRVMAAA